MRTWIYTRFISKSACRLGDYIVSKVRSRPEIEYILIKEETEKLIKHQKLRSKGTYPILRNINISLIPLTYMTFSWTKDLERVKQAKIEDAIIMATVGTNPDYQDEHPDEIKDAKANNYVKIKARVIKEHDKKVNQYRNRRLRIAGKN